MITQEHFGEDHRQQAYSTVTMFAAPEPVDFGGKATQRGQVTQPMSKGWSMESTDPLYDLQRERSEIYSREVAHYNEVKMGSWNPWTSETWTKEDNV